MDLEFLEAFKEEWKPVSKAALVAWLIFYAFTREDICCSVSWATR